MAQGDGGQVNAWLDKLVDSLQRLHAQILELSGGMQGEHTSRLISAAARPFHTMFGEDLYPTPYDKAGALLHGIVCDHCFVDGNKRTGTMAAIGLLVAFGVCDDKAPRPIQVRMTGDIALDAARGQLTAAEVSFWLRRVFEFPHEPDRDGDEELQPNILD